MPKKNTYQAAFKTLQKNATLLQDSKEIDIDKLSCLVEESIDAYHICQERILAVERALKQSFDSLNSDTKETTDSQI